MRERLFAANMRVCEQRAVIVTDIYKQNEAQPFIIKRALALEAVLRNMGIYIMEDEVLVGGIASSIKAAPVFPEYSVDWLERELNDDPIPMGERPGEPFEISDESKETLQQKVIPYWKGRTQLDYLKNLLTNEMWDTVFKIKSFDVSWLIVGGDGHTIPDYEKVIKEGLGGIIREAEETLQGMDKMEPSYPGKAIFIESVIRVNKAVVMFAKRYAEKARELAGSCGDPERKKELLKIAQTCEWVPENPARNFREAIQSMLFAHLVVQIESNGHSISLGRADQYLYPYYEKDIADGSLSNTRAFELLNCLWLKLGEVVKLRDWDNTKFFVGNPLFQNLTIGGQTRDRQDAVNTLSYLMLACTKKLKVSQPSFTVRYFNDTSERFLMECVKTIKLGIGMPAIYNDEAIIPSMLSIGYEYGDALNYGVTGCVEPSPHGKIGGRLGGSFCNIAKIFEIALNGGLDPRTGFKTGPKGKSFSDMQSYDEVITALKRQMDYQLDLHVRADNIIDDLIAEKTPCPFLSSLIEDCIRRGTDVKAGGAKYDYTVSQEVGTACVANGLAAIRKLVFEERVITQKQLKHALDTDFSDDTTEPTGEMIRKMLVNKAPKYGNNDDYVDMIEADLIEYWSSQKQLRRNSRFGKGPIGGFFLTSTATVSSNVPMGSFVGATADGRKAGAPLSEGISAYRGTDVNGPTALINSVGKLPNYLVAGGQLLNVKINPQCLQTEQGLKSLLTLTKGLFAKKGFHIQFNIVSSEMLKEAMKNPDDYRDLIVRVAGYSAYFVTLNPMVQKDIIERTEHLLN
jgi:formate C-acetyltransferase